MKKLVLGVAPIKRAFLPMEAAKEQKDIFGAAYRCRIVSWKRIFIRSGRKPYTTGSKRPGNLSEYDYPGRNAGGTLYGDRRSTCTWN